MSLNDYSAPSGDNRLLMWDNFEDFGGGGGGGNSHEDDEYRRNPPIDNGHARVNCKIDQMIVKDHKESWLGGKSDVSIRAKLAYHNGREYGNPWPASQVLYSSDQYSDYMGHLIRRFSRREVRNQTAVTVDYSLQQNWENQFPFVDPVHFNYIIFERDPWPAGVKTWLWQGYDDIRFPFNDNRRFSYDMEVKARSSNDCYSYGYITNSLAITQASNEYSGLHVTNNSFISYNTTHY